MRLAGPEHFSVRRRPAGFTLMETLVVLAICVGLVGLVSGIYRAVARSAVSLRAGAPEWAFQREFRERLLHLFAVTPVSVRPLDGESSELYVLSWVSRAGGNSGKPVIARYRYDQSERVLYYQEQPLPGWWQGAAQGFVPGRLHSEVGEASARKVLTGVDAFSFEYLPRATAERQSDRWLPAWRQDEAPNLVQLRFSRAGRNYTLWFETRVTDG